LSGVLMRSDDPLEAVTDSVLARQYASGATTRHLTILSVR